MYVHNTSTVYKADKVPGAHYKIVSDYKTNRHACTHIRDIYARTYGENMAVNFID